jgi:hypothetical protein
MKFPDLQALRLISSWGAAEQAKLFIGKKEVTYEVTI